MIRKRVTGQRSVARRQLRTAALLRNLELLRRNLHLQREPVLTEHELGGVQHLQRGVAVVELQ